MKKFTSRIIITILIAVLLTACGQKQESKVDESQGTTNTSNSKKEVVLPTTDRAGNEITIPEEIDKIISLAPSNTQILVELGLEDKIVAADTQSQTFSVLSEEIPYFDMMAPDAEQIIALEPDIILVSAMSMIEGDDPYKSIADMGICIAYIPSSTSIEGIYEDIMFIADALQVSDEGKKIVDNMKTKIAEVQAIGETIEEKKSVYFEIAAAPNLYSFGNGVFLNQMIELIGGKNILSDLESWVSISEEAVIAANPDVIITNINYIDNPVDEILSRPGWEKVTAVKNQEVYYVDNMSSSIPDHNIMKALEEMAEAVYPDHYDYEK